MQKFKSRKNILEVEKSPVYHHSEIIDPSNLLNDIYAFRQYQFSSVNAAPAINYMKGKGKTVVAVIDDGLLYTHEDLKGNIHYNQGEMGTDSQGRDKRSNNIDDDGNGFVDDYHGWDFSDWDNDVRPPLSKAYFSRWGHGTFIAGLIGAVTNNNLGIAAISDNHIEIMGLKCAADVTDGRFYYHRDLGPAIRYAADNGATVINMSWGGAGYSSYLRSFLQYAYDRNVILVSSAGNNNSSGLHYPASYPEVISVGSLTDMDRKSSFSNYGPLVDIYAPGSYLYSTRPNYYFDNGAYGYGSGTSYSAPLVAAASGLIKIIEPDLNTDLVRQIITSAGTNIDAYNSISMGYGKLNLHKSLLTINNLEGHLDFSIESSVVYPGEAISISNNSLLLDPTSYEWHFPGSQTEFSDEEEPAVIYEKPGIYRFSVSVKDLNGKLLSSTEGNTIIVEEPELESNILGFLPSEFQESEKIVRTADSNDLYRKFPIDSDAWLIGFNVVALGDYERFLWYYISVRDSKNTLPYFTRFRFSEKDLELSKGDEMIWNFLEIDEPLPIKKGDLFLSAQMTGYARENSNQVFQKTGAPFLPSNESLYQSTFNQSFYPDSGTKGTLLLMPVIADKLPENTTMLDANREDACIGDTLRAEIVNFNPETEYTWWMAKADVVFKGNRTARFSFPEQGRTNVSVRSKTVYDLVKFDQPFYYEYQHESSVAFNIIDCDAPPEIWFTGLPRDEEDNRGVRITAGKRVYFNNESTNYTKIKWYFEGGDPQYSDEENPIVYYREPGNYRVKLSAKQMNGEYTSLLRKAYVAVEQSPWQPEGSSEREDVEPLSGEVLLFPNPNHSAELTILGIEPQTEVMIRSVNGKLLSSHVADPGSSISIQNLGPGMYVVQVRKPDGDVVHRKLLVE